MDIPIHGQPPKRHHYVPEFVLRPWAREWRPHQHLLRGYYWDTRTSHLRFREKGPKAFCHGIDLLTLRAQPEKRGQLESVFFQAIDDRGSAAVQKLIADGPSDMNGEQRSDLVRLLLSMEYRRPVMINKLRTEGRSALIEGLDVDKDLKAEFERRQITEKPSEYATRNFGWSFENESLLIIQKLVDNKPTGQLLINSYWYLRRLKKHHGNLVLGDRPLVRVHGLASGASVWYLPLSPKIGFFLTQDRTHMQRLQKASASKLIEKANESTISQAEKYVFTVDVRHEGTIRRHFRARASKVTTKQRP